MDLSGISSLRPAQQTLTASQARAFELRLGQELTATVLAMVDDRVLLDMGNGQTLAARPQTEQQLVPGQIVQLVVTDVQPEQVTLRLVAENVLSGAAGGQALTSAGLEDNLLNRAVLVALISEGQPVTAEAVRSLRQMAAALGASAPEDIRAAAYLLARGLPQTAAMLAVVREGLTASQRPDQLELQLRSQAEQLLQSAAQELDSAAPELRTLLAQLASAPAASAGMPGEPALRALLQQLTLSVEAMLAGMLDQQPPASDEQAGSANSAAAPEQVPNPPPPLGQFADPPLAGLQAELDPPSAGQGGDLGPRSPTPGLPATHTGLEGTAQELVRRLIPALDRALQSGAGPATLATAGELRHTAERFVQALQFQQLQTVLQPTPAEPYVVYALPMPYQQGEGDLRLYVRDDAGRPNIDPNDVRLVIDLRLSQLERVSIVVHLYRRQLTCHMEAESPRTRRLLEAAAPQLQHGLRSLGFEVDPIHCSMDCSSSRDLTEVELPLDKLGRFNVTA